MTNPLLSIVDITRIYGRSEGAIKTALWRHGRDQRDPGFPLPKIIGGRYRWSADDVEHDLRVRFGPTIDETSFTREEHAQCNPTAPFKSRTEKAENQTLSKI